MGAMCPMVLGPVQWSVPLGLHIWGVLYRSGLYAAVSGKGSPKGIFLFLAYDAHVERTMLL